MYSLQSRPALDVEDDAAPARSANQPLALPRVAEPERSAADAPDGHLGCVARTGRRLPFGVRLANRPLFGGLVSGVLLGHDICTTTLPNCSPLASRSNARRPSSSENTLSTGGMSRPARSSFTTASNSASLPIVEPRSDHWFQNRR